jgi:serine/threonine protein kinase
MHSRGLLNERDAAECIRQLLYAVIYLHEDVRILHRDLKLGNMLLTDQLTVKLADFGLATAIDDLNRRDSSSSSICG